VLPEIKLEGVRFRVFRREALRASGEAATISLRRDSTDVSARDLVAVLPQEGTPPVRIVASQGQGVLADRTFEATGGVTLSRGDDAARTSSARYEPGPGGGLVRGDEPVVVEGRGYRLEGPRFTLDPATSEIAIEGGASLAAGLPDPR
jgi:lipopolysaccharide export system protein LptC